MYIYSKIAQGDSPRLEKGEGDREEEGDRGEGAGERGLIWNIGEPEEQRLKLIR